MKSAKRKLTNHKLEQIEVWQQAKLLTSKVMRYLPKEEIPETLVLWSCLKYLNTKSLGLDWKTEIDCYLGVPIHVEKFDKIQEIQFAKFPLALISSLTVQKPFYFSLLREECIDGTTLDGSSHLMHFTPNKFFECETNFRERLEDGNLDTFMHFSDERGFYMQDENLDEKLKDDEVKYAYFFKEALLNDEYYLRLDILKADIFLSSLMMYFELSHGLDYALLGLKDYDENEIDAINAQYVEWDLQNFHSFVLERNDAHFTYLCSGFNTFVSFLYSHYEMIVEHFDEDPENHILECEIEMIEHLAKNTDQKILDEILGKRFERF